MMRHLVLTLSALGRMRTYSVDPEVCSMMRIEADTPSGVVELARVEGSGEVGERRLSLACSSSVKISGEQSAATEKEPISLDRESIFSIDAPELGAPAVLYCRPASEGARVFEVLGFTGDAEVSIGRAPGAALRYDCPYVSSKHAVLSCVDDEFAIEDLDSGNGTFVNGRALAPRERRALRAGDVVQIMDLTIMMGFRYIVSNRPAGTEPIELAQVRPLDRSQMRAASPPPAGESADPSLFYPAPRLMHTAHARAFSVDGPPAAKKADDAPAAMKIGPSFLMGLSSVFMIANSVAKVGEGASALSLAPMIAMSVSMIGGSVLWPAISRGYEKRRDARDERARESAYTDYLDRLELELRRECESQQRVLREMRPAVQTLLADAQALVPGLMNRTSAHADFLDLRVGSGSAPLAADISWPERKFSMDEDHLLSKVFAMASNQPCLENVPLVFNPSAHTVAAVLGPRADAWAFLRGLVAQICALMSYQDVKIMLVADRDEEREWGFMRPLRHMADDAGRTRFLATEPEALAELAMLLERELERRGDVRADSPFDYGTYFIVICANKALADRSETLGRIARMRANQGISLLWLGSELRDLPRECSYVIDLCAPASPAGSSGSARMFDRADVSGTEVVFEPDVAISTEEAGRFSRAIARVRLDTPGTRSQLPASLSFLEMMRAGNVPALAVAQRWAKADASRSLACPVGVDAAGEPAVINVHEAVHGPHGLIAGTTGSGKSEFIITWILSLAATYPPDQVAFVLIDYKGGGLAGAFENDRVRLPHLAGTITNLDGAAISRSLVSIRSELRRRQAVLAEAREATGEATMDIYRYIRHYLAGELAEPLPHLLIVADEFAELKDQQPEFMEELMSAARIGRSLGVHLVLATQKPSGVVSDQIRSNMRFKVCLKVADAADSKEMIGRPDAADIRGPGRFYMLVGYNEHFLAGQAAYAGAPYAPVDVWSPRVDDAVDAVDERLDVTASVKKRRETRAADGIEEINAVLEGVREAASGLPDARAEARPLWLAPLPAHIGLAELEQRYSYEAQTDILDPVVGELDDPAAQRKHLLTLPLSSDGNAVIYGAPESGSESILTTLLYGLIAHHGAEEVSLYIIDFGSEGLAAFSDAPHTGGVVLAGDDERLRRLFSHLRAEIASRRRTLVRYGGFDNYRKSVPDHFPAVVIAINNMASFYELYESYEPQLISMTREGPAVGIVFLVTAPTQNSMRMRLRANFKCNLVVQFNDEADYVAVLGPMRGMVAPRDMRRGLVGTDGGIREYQGASIAAEDGAEFAVAAALAHERARASNGFHADPIPSLPEQLSLADITRSDIISALPYGIYEETLLPACLDIANQVVSRVLYAKTSQVRGFISAWAPALRSLEDIDVSLLDAGGLLREGSADASGDDAVARSLERLAALRSVPRQRPLVCVVTGFAGLLQRLPPDRSNAIKSWLASLGEIDRIRLVIVDGASQASSCVQHDWFKEQASVKDALWVGGGIAGQTSLSLAFSGKQPETKLADDMGYEVASGVHALVKLVSVREKG